MAHVQPTPQQTNSPELYAWSVTGPDHKSHWTKIGAAWTHRDGKGFNITLDALPVNGKIVLREPLEDEEDQDQDPSGQETSPQEPQAQPA
ncbi:hypothetical protein AADZ90_021840 [Aestuariibius sp. 2305UL40-4]|uniref:hypothetical protein n=1 Tax=Aestuariibius violaceus TaxID=3234132 RepID=UPI00345ED76F